MDERLKIESAALARSWMQHDEDMLSSYLVRDVEDPRTNIQSILTRHFLTVSLFGARFEQLLEHELRFALVLNWFRSWWERAGGVEDLPSLRHALAVGADNAEGLTIPSFVSAVHRLLPAQLGAGERVVPDYLSELLARGAEPGNATALSERVLDTFQRLWAETFAPENSTSLSVLEPACGSANDYRFLASYGLARLIDYTGFDLCPKNTQNARRMFPQARFRVGNVFDIDSPDRSFDLSLVHDLFEHLSLQGLEAALAEVCRVTRRGLSLGFFNLHEADEHLIRPVGEYHWNTLSLPRLRAMLAGHGFETRVIHIETFTKWRFGCDQAHNQNAYTLLAERTPG